MARKRIKLPKSKQLENMMAEGAAKRFAEEDATKLAEESQRSARIEKFRDQIDCLSDYTRRFAWMRFDRGEDPDVFLPELLNPNRGTPKAADKKMVHQFGAKPAGLITSVEEVRTRTPSDRTTSAAPSSDAGHDRPEIPNQNDWGTIIRDRIKAEGWSCYALGITSGVDASIILRFVAGARDIRLETAQKLCAALGLALVPLSGE